MENPSKLAGLEEESVSCDLTRPELQPSMVLGFDVLNKENQMKLPRDPHLLLLKIGLAIILAIDLYKYIAFIATR